MLIQLQLLPFIQHTFFLPCSAAAILQTAKVRESYVKSLRCFQCCSQEISHWTFLFYMCCGCDCLTQIMIKKSFLFFKKILGRLVLIGTHF